MPTTNDPPDSNNPLDPHLVAPAPAFAPIPTRSSTDPIDPTNPPRATTTSTNGADAGDVDDLDAANTRATRGRGSSRASTPDDDLYATDPGDGFPWGLPDLDDDGIVRGDEPLVDADESVVDVLEQMVGLGVGLGGLGLHHTFAPEHKVGPNGLWLVDDEDLAGIARPLARIVGRRLPKAARGKVNPDVIDGLEVMVATSAYAMKNMQEGVLVRAAGAAVGGDSGAVG